jgi:hypothetical protein
MTMDEIRAVIREELATSEARVSRLVEDTSASLQREMNARFDAVERRLDRTENNTNAILMQMAGVSRSLTQAERAESEYAVNSAAQQRAIDQLAARVTKLEQRLGQQDQH